jgi:hypothetical protein
VWDLAVRVLDIFVGMTVYMAKQKNKLADDQGHGMSVGKVTGTIPSKKHTHGLPFLHFLQYCWVTCPEAENLRRIS